MTKYCPTCAAEYSDVDLLCRVDGVMLTTSKPACLGSDDRDELEGVTQEIPQVPQQPARVSVTILGVTMPVEPGPGLIIGRLPEQSVFAAVLESAGHTNVGRLHCHLRIGGQGEIEVTDLNSTNGTFINDTPLAPNTAQPLRPGDRLRLAANREVELKWS